MNLVGHNTGLIEELKIHTIKKLNEYHKEGYIVEGKFDELMEKETKGLDQRIKDMSEWL